MSTANPVPSGRRRPPAAVTAAKRARSKARAHTRSTARSATQDTTRSAALAPVADASEATGPATAHGAWRSGLRTRREQLGTLLNLPVTTYYLILFSVLALTVFGLVMVLSASSITSYAGGRGSSFTIAIRQGVFAAVGVTLMFVAARMSLLFWERVSMGAVLLGLSLQVLPLVPGFGATRNGSQSWIEVGPVQLQPAEFLKLALVLFIGVSLAKRFHMMPRLTAVLPVGLVAGAGVTLVLLGHDLGTGIILMLLVFGALFVGGLPWRYILLLVGSGVAVVAAMVLTSRNRMVRIQALITGHASEQTDALGDHWQSNHGLYALASGKWFGVGLGASREKWSWLPEAHNDFIFAIIGEELGLVGTVAVIAMFGVLAYAMIRIIHRTRNRMVQAATAGIFMWIVGQAAVNIGVVCGLLPVIGVPLPFVSYGGSALISNLLAAGLLLSFARCEPGAREALRLGRRPPAIVNEGK